MNRRGWIAVLVGAAVLAAAVAWWLHTYKRVDEWIDLPRTGEAASNPLFALRVSLEKAGRPVRAWRRLDLAAMRPAATDTVLFDGDPRTVSDASQQRLLDWVRGGGHLIIATPASDAAMDALSHRSPQLRSARGDAGHVDVPLLDAIGVHARRGPAQCFGIAGGVGSWGNGFCGGRRFDAPATARLHWGDAAGDVFARVPVGRGSVDVIASLRFVTTDVLDDAPHAELAHQLLDAHRGTVHLVHSTDVPSLWWTLIRRGWPVWLPLLLLLAGWLWARMRRLGPLLPSPEAGRRSLLEHVDASGEHQWRYGHGDRLHLAMLDAFHARLRRRDPQAAALQGDVQVARLADRFGLPTAQIVDALTPPDPRDAKSLVARIKTLVLMRNRL